MNFLVLSPFHIFSNTDINNKQECVITDFVIKLIKLYIINKLRNGQNIIYNIPIFVIFKKQSSQ